MIDNELQKLKGKIDLSRQEMLDVMDLIMSGSLQDNEIEEFLIAMNEKGASINEISSAASVMRDKSCLLYTSPSPRDVVPSRMPSSA